MARVPEMSFCEFGSPAPPTAREVELHKTVESRFSLEGKTALS
jgi:hypothetical protein